MPAASISALLLSMLELCTKTKLAKLSVGTFVALTGSLTAIQLETVRWFVAHQLNVPNTTTDLLYYLHYNAPYPIDTMAYGLKNTLVNFHWIF